jgi:mannose-6-phosphate isomerase-like protein (cupin superfamily)
MSHDDAERPTDETPGSGDTARPDGAFDLSTTHIHLGLGARVVPLPDFEWTPAYLEAYSERFGDDGDDGRLVMMYRNTESWPTWERHPAGEEVVVLLSGRVDLIQRLDGGERCIALRPGQAVINPPGVWHTADVHEPGDALFITPGRGTENVPR